MMQPRATSSIAHASKTLIKPDNDITGRLTEKRESIPMSPRVKTMSEKSEHKVSLDSHRQYQNL